MLDKHKLRHRRLRQQSRYVRSEQAQQDERRGNQRDEQRDQLALVAEDADKPESQGQHERQQYPGPYKGPERIASARAEQGQQSNQRGRRSE